jgi:23S rRNA (guanosine2251-2'-O)-methyltransferase
MAETYIGGFHAVIAAIEDGDPKPREVLLAETRRDARAEKLMEIAARRKITVRIVARDTLDLYAPGLRHQGVLASIDAADISGEEVLDLPATPDRLILALDGVQDPHNLGACLRTADACGALAVVVPKDRAANLTPVVRKVAAGAAESVPLVTVTNLVRTLKLLKEAQLWVTGADADAPLTAAEVDFTGGSVLVMGAEGAGLRQLTRQTCDYRVRLPQLGAVESLNVSVAAGMLLYEVVRQRNIK